MNAAPHQDVGSSLQRGSSYSALQISRFSVQGRAAHGEPDGNRHPSVGAVVVDLPGVGIAAYGTGTLIHERVFLTAGHIAASILAGHVTLLGVSFDPEVDLEHGTWLPVSGVVGTFTGVTASADPRQSDIGALILGNPVTGITPATLPTPNLLNDLKRAGLLRAGSQGAELTVVGYGWDLSWSPPTPIIPMGIVPRKVAQSDYLALNDGWLIMNQNLAAGYGGTAFGDSGGPTFWTDPDNGQEILVGITSWGAQLVANGFSYRVDIDRSLQFIQEMIDSLGAE